MGSGGSSYTSGYKYYVGMHMALCHGPADQINQIKVNDLIAWTGPSGPGTITINNEELFGGLTREGGISGNCDFLSGVVTQGQNTYLLGVLGSLLPAFRSVASLILNKVYIGLNPYLKPWSIEMQRIHLQQDGITQWEDSLAQITVVGYDILGTPVNIAAMNPAHIIRECLTNTLWGMGYSSGDIEDTSFLAVATTLAAETLGMCLIWDTQTAIEDFIKIVLQHIDGVVYVDRRTGKFVLKLVRLDYDPSTLIVLDESNIDDIADFSRPAFGDLFNSLTVNYWNEVSDVAISVTIQDIALQQEQNGGPINTTVTYEGFVDPISATKAGQRDLRTLSTPLITCTITTDSIAKDLNIGDVFKLSWASYEMTEVVMRVTGAAYGNGKTRRTKLKCVQDVFAFPEVALIPQVLTAWRDPRSVPTAPEYQLAFELPYYELARSTGQTTIDNAISLNQAIGFVGAAATKPPSGITLGGLMWTDNGSGYAQVDTVALCGGATLSANADYLDGTIHISSKINLELGTIGGWLQIDNELMIIQAIGSNTITVARAALDTMPAKHTAGAVVLLWDYFNCVDSTEYVQSDVVDVKIRTFNGRGVLPLASATPMVVNVVGRPARPYPPKRIKLNGNFYPTSAIAGDIVVTWVDRNRLLETGGTLLGFTDGGITIEAGVVYEIRVYDQFNTLQHTYSGLTGHTYTIPAGDLTPFVPYVTIEMDSNRSGLYSFQKFSLQVSVINVETTESGSAITTESGVALELE